MRNLSYFLVTSEIFCELSHPQRNLYMFETPSSPRIFLFSKDKKACLIIADLSHAKKVSTQELYINDEKYLSEKHSRSDILIINCFLGEASVSPTISPNPVSSRLMVFLSGKTMNSSHICKGQLGCDFFRRIARFTNTQITLQSFVPLN